MKINLFGDTNEIIKGAEILQKRLGYKLASDGINVAVVKRPGNLEIVSDGKNAEVCYENKVHFFRALGLLCQHYGKSIDIREEVCFNKNGVMIDASRNGVMRPTAICDFIEIMAVMGLNLIMMYTEDTFEVPEYPYFGYMRGRYTYDELRRCDEYADIFGIEMIPCIQTMGHMRKSLKWQQNGLHIVDTEDNIYIGHEDTYKFLKDIIRAASAPFKSNRIHIGLDEAWFLGTGILLRERGYKTPTELISEHFARLKKIIDDLGLEAIMWPDMFFRATNPERRYDPDVEFSEQIKKSVPQNWTLAYYDYTSKDEDYITRMINKHKELSNKICFAGGMWTWGNMNLNYTRAIRVAIPALNACRKNKIKEVFVTLWADDGNQTNVYEALYGMQIYAEMGYGHEADNKWFADRFYACTGEDAEAFLQFGSLDNIGQVDFENGNPSVYLLWQDILLGLCDAHVDRDDLPQIYAERREWMLKNSEKSKNYKTMFLYAANLANVLELKADLGVRIKKAYDDGNKKELARIKEIVLPELYNRIIEFKEVFRKLWLLTYKAFGFEVIDMRLGSVLARVESAEFRLGQYLSGEIDEIEELIPERLPYKLFDGEYREGLNMRTLIHLKYISAACCSHEIFD